MTLTRIPLTQRQAVAFIAAHHRHNRPPRGDVIRLGLADETGELVAVGTAGRPVSRILDDGLTLEVLRICTLGHANACSMLYGSLARAGTALGWRRLITYTRADELGSSLRASGFVVDHERGPRDSWPTPARPRTEYGEGGIGRIRWVRAL